MGDSERALSGQGVDTGQPVAATQSLLDRLDRRRAFAGQQLIYDVELLQLGEVGASVKGRVTALEPPNSQSELLAEAEIFFAHLDQARSQQLFGDHNFVFSGELKHMLGLVKVLAGRKEGS